MWVIFYMLLGFFFFVACVVVIESTLRGDSGDDGSLDDNDVGMLDDENEPSWAMRLLGKKDESIRTFKFGSFGTKPFITLNFDLRTMTVILSNGRQFEFELDNVVSLSWEVKRLFKRGALYIHRTDGKVREIKCPVLGQKKLDQINRILKQLPALKSERAIQRTLPSVGESTGPRLVAELERLAELREAGALTPAEFAAAKRKLLSD